MEYKLRTGHRLAAKVPRAAANRLGISCRLTVDRGPEGDGYPLKQETK